MNLVLKGQVRVGLVVITAMSRSVKLPIAGINGIRKFKEHLFCVNIDRFVYIDQYYVYLG